MRTGRPVSHRCSEGADRLSGPMMGLVISTEKGNGVIQRHYRVLAHTISGFGGQALRFHG